MATAYTGITSYRDPGAVDMDSTFKAQRFKQEAYSTNTSAIQSLVNQYVGTDLLRDVDQQYLGDRLKTLTEYVNQTGGNGDWSKKSVFNDVSNYIGQALDANVMAGVVSTQQYRKQQAELVDIKKNKPDQYAVQNEYMATRDLQRYLSSDQLGDTYKPGSYTPYTDVKKELLENSKYLKDFGVETYLDSKDGNVYFRTIETRERLTKDTANQYVDMVLGEKGKTQLMIDGIYNYKNVSTEQLKTEYDSYIDNVSDNYSKSAKALRLKATNSPKNQQSQLNAEAQTLEAMANDTSSYKGILKDRDSIASNLYMNQFKQKWSDMLSYDRLKDWKIDDSGLQVAKFNQDIRQADITNAFKTAELEMDSQRLGMDRTKLDADLKAKGLKLDANGNVTEDPNSIRNPINAGITATQEAKDLEELEITPAQQVFADYDQAYGTAIKEGSNALIQTLNKPENSELRKALGFEGKDAKYIINSMIVNPSGYNKLMNNLDDNTKDLIRTAQYAYKEKETLKQKVKPLESDIQRISNGIYNSPDGANSFKNNFNLFQGGQSIDEKGNLIKKDVRKSNSLNDRKVREIGVINSLIKQGGKLDTDEKALLYQKQLDILKSMKLTPAQYQKAKDNLISQDTGFFEGVGANISAGLIAMNPSIVGGLRSIDATINALNVDNKSAGKSYIAGTLVESASKSDLFNNSLVNNNNQSSNRRGAYGYVLDQFNDMGRTNYDIDDIGDTDLPGLVDGSTVEARMKGVLQNAKQEAIKMKGRTTFLNNINVDLASDAGKEIISNLKANLPIGSEIQKDGNVQYRLDPTTGQATVIVPVKNGKEISPVELSMPIQNVPQQVLNRVDLEKKQYQYSANNPNSLGYEGFAEVPSSRKDWLSQIEMLPANERTNAVNNPPKTQEDIVKEMERTFSPELVKQYKAEINDIVNRPVNFSMVPENGQWTMVGKQGSEVVLRKPTGQEYIDPNIMDKYVDKLGTEQIIENVKLLLRTRQ